LEYETQVAEKREATIAEQIDMYPQEKMDVPANFVPEYPYKDAMGCSVNLRDEKLAPFPRTEYAVRIHRREYYAIISHLDTQIGRILDALEKSGKKENTYIFLTADNGLAIGAHGLFGKQNLFEHSVKVPLLVAGPGLPKNQRIAEPVYLQDIVPTSLNVAGIDVPDHVQFKSILPLIRGEEQRHYDAIYGAYMMLQRMVRKDDFKLIAYPEKNICLLFNLKNDPDEINNLADRPEYAAKVQELLSELTKLQKETGDTLTLNTDTMNEC
jgi:arylsulfatase A-like enzyme